MSTLPEYDTAILVYICQEIVGLCGLSHLESHPRTRWLQGLR